MAINTGSYLKGFYDKTTNLGLKAINSDFTLEIEGYEGSYLLVKQAPWPELSPQGEIEISTPLGATAWQPQQVKVAQQGSITLYETVAGDIEQMMVDMLVNGGVFNAKIYEGTPQHYVRVKTMRDCFLQLDQPDRDWENRSQVLTFTGTIFYHYFGECEEGSGKAEDTLPYEG